MRDICVSFLFSGLAVLQQDISYQERSFYA
jgi:hypothetical protein